MPLQALKTRKGTKAKECKWSLEDDDGLQLTADSNALRAVMLNEISQPEKDKYHIISIICGMLKKKKKRVYKYRDQIGDYQKLEAGG